MARHHESKKARRHEHMGMERYERGPVRKHAHHEDPRMHKDEQPFHLDGRDMSQYKGHYEGREGRRYEEMLSAGMINEDHHAIANLPQAPIIKPYPKTRHYMDEGLDDTITGIDKQMEEDAPRGLNYSPHKF